MLHSSTNLEASLHQLNVGRWAIVGIGTLLVILGILAFSATLATTIISIVFLGVILLVAGIIEGVTAFRAGSVGWVVLRLLFAVLTVLAGILLIKRPVAGAVTLTLFMAWYFIFAGIVKAISALVVRPPFTGWEVFSSIITFLLGLLLLVHWPLTGLFAIGIFIAIDLLFFGISLLLGAFTVPTALDAHRETPQATV